MIEIEDSIALFFWFIYDQEEGLHEGFELISISKFCTRGIQTN